MSFNIFEYVKNNKENLEKGIIDKKYHKDICNYIFKIYYEDISYLKVKIILLYEELLKYKYIPSNQSEPQITFINYLKCFINISDNYILELINNKLINYWYKEAVNNINQSVLLNNKLEENIPEELLLNKLLEDEYIESWLKKYSYTFEAKYTLNIWEGL